jgi:hypothetical protein
VLAGTEECDDGNADDTDECIAGCILATCGDGFILGPAWRAATTPTTSTTTPAATPA